MIGIIEKPANPILIVERTKYFGPNGNVNLKQLPKKRLEKHTILSVRIYKQYLSRKPEITNDPTSPQIMNTAPKILASTDEKPYDDTRLLIMAPKHVYTPYNII